MGDVLVPGEHHVDLELGHESQDVARVPHRVAFSARARYRHQVVVEDEDFEVGRMGVLLSDPRVPLASDLALGQVGLGGVHGHHLHVERRSRAVAVEHEAQHAVALLGHVARTEGVAEVQVPDVLGVVVAGDDEGVELGFEEGLDEALGGAELARVALGREIAADDDEVGVQGDGLLDGGVEELGVEVRGSAVQIGELGEDEGVAGHRHVSLGEGRARATPGTVSPMIAKAAVIGAGSWGTAVASLVARETPVVLWARRAELAEQIERTRVNREYLPDFQLPKGLRATADLEEAVSHTDVIVMGVPSHGFRDVLVQAAPFVGGGVPMVSLTKGVEQQSLRRMTEVVAEVLPGHPYGVLTGPNLSREVVAGYPTASVVAMSDLDLATDLQRLFSTDSFRVYTNPDV